jgi:uncharacterized ion transporter superfamily protein YfcC
MTRFRFPTAYTILFGLIVLVAGLTWVVPAGQYDMVENDQLGKMIPVAGSYHEVEANPQGLTDIFMAPVAGFYDPGSYEASAIDVALFVLFIGGFLGVVAKTGAIDAGINRVTGKLKGREIWMIPILMTLFAVGGTVYGMAEETLAFYALIIPVIIAAGYDSLTAVAVIMLGAGIGTLGSTINPFATVIASDAAGIPFTEGMAYRLFLLIAGLLICIAYVMRYAMKVKKQPKTSLVADMEESNKEHFLTEQLQDNQQAVFTTAQKIILGIFTACFGLLVYGVSALGWWMAEMSALFLAGSILVAIVAKMDEQKFTATFVDGAKDLLGVALVIGLARGIVVIMDSGNLTGTILNASEGMVTGLSEVGFINGMFGVQVLLSFFVPSSSGLAVLSMPVMAPLAEFSGVASHLAVTTYQSASGLVNLITPTSAVVMGGLAIGRVPFERWVKFVLPLLGIITLLIMATLTVGVIVH